MPVRVDCDLNFGYVGGDAGSGDQLNGSLESAGTELILTLDAIPVARAGRMRPMVRRLAGTLHQQGITLQVRTPAGEQIRLGHGVRGGLLSRLATGSPRVKITGWRTLLVSGRGRGGVQLSDLIPPSTPVPLSPTFVRLQHSVRTTHDPGGGGRPRLYFAAPLDHEGEPPRVFSLPPRDTVIGSADSADLRLVGLAAQHAVVRRTASDEYTIEPAASGGELRVGGRIVTTAVTMRTGTRIELAGWRMSYFREEFADHGRPYGGRLGGEAGYQRPQSRPEFRPPR